MAERGRLPRLGVGSGLGIKPYLGRDALSDCDDDDMLSEDEEEMSDVSEGDAQFDELVASVERRIAALEKCVRDIQTFFQEHFNATLPNTSNT